jgi:hypothetical protein
MLNEVVTIHLLQDVDARSITPQSDPYCYVLGSTDATMMDARRHMVAGTALVRESEDQMHVAVVDDRFVTTARGSAPDRMPDGPIPSSPSDFLQQVMRTLNSTPLLSTPSRRKRHRAPPSGTVPRRSSRPAKKARNWAPAVAAAQNVLMWKLGLASSAHIETADYDRYLELFDQGLSEEQARRIDEPFMAGSIAMEFATEPVDGTVM